MFIYVLLTTVAFLTAAISAVTGMGGGMLLLATMFCFMAYADAIPTHALVQLVSNSTRAIVYLPSVNWLVFRRFIYGAIPGSFVAIGLLIALGRLERSEPYLKLLIGIYILVAAYMPKGKAETHSSHWWDWPLMGLAAGSAALLIGAAGPLIAPLFARRAFLKEPLIATKAACQMFLHIAKLPAFLYLRAAAPEGSELLRSPLEVEQLGLLALIMGLATIPGTLFGKRMLRHVSERLFVILFRAALTFAGAKVLIIDGLWPLCSA